MLFARSSVVNHAKAFDLSAIDMCVHVLCLLQGKILIIRHRVCIAHKDMGILREESEEGAQLGFTGKVRYLRPS